MERLWLYLWASQLLGRVAMRLKCDPFKGVSDWIIHSSAHQPDETEDHSGANSSQQLISTVFLSLLSSLSLFCCPPLLISVALCLSLCPHQVLSSSLAGSFAGCPPLISELSGWVSPSSRWMFLFFSFSWPSYLTPHTLSYSLSLCVTCVSGVCMRQS